MTENWSNKGSQLGKNHTKNIEIIFYFVFHVEFYLEFCFLDLKLSPSLL